MRLHELSITAFGPFVDTVTVDFDELAAAGVFLLTGDTGAGKTSVLDAVCFALYGEVPGDRHAARHLRSDHADPAAEPRVVLRVSIGHRTFRFTRSPSWERPKRRGSGNTRVQAHVVVEEQQCGEWVALTNRLDEAGKLVTTLLGMTCTQFTQVAMLPQGRFQAFLRATSTERHAVLQRLFRTRRFEEVERWLVDRRQTLRRRSQTFHDRTAGVVNRLQEASGAPTPDGWDLHDLDPVAAEGSLLPWSERLTQTATTAAQSLERDTRTATRRLTTARDALEEAKAVAEARRRGQRARATLAELEASAEAEAVMIAAVEAHRRAASVLPAALRAETATAAAKKTETAAAVHLARVTPLLGVPADEVRSATLTQAASRANESRAVAESWLPRETELHDERARSRSLAAQVAHLQAQIGAIEQQRTELARTRTRTVPLVAETRQLAGRCEASRLAVESADAGLAAARQVVEVTAQLAETRARLDETTQHAQDLRERYLDLRERRISGMAAELAVGLAAGCSCPVCGSAEHPSPATASSQVSRAEEDAAREAHETADFERQAVKDVVTGLDSLLQGARRQSRAHDTAHWAGVRASAAAALERSLDADRRLGSLETELASLGEREIALTTALAAARATLEARAQQCHDSETRCQKLATELAGLLDVQPGADSVAALVELHAHAVEVLEEARDALTRHDRATAEVVQARTGAEAAALAAGFDSLPAALGAVLTGSGAAERSAALDVRRATRTAATATLDEVAVAHALEQPAPDLAALEATVQQAESVRDRAHAEHRQAAARAERLVTLGLELAREAAAWEPVRRDHAVTAALASLVEGRSADNQLKMRLSAYVLSERLRQVVAAANERLGDMTDQRYALEQADEKGAGEQRGGLSLLVRDEWSGKRRDPATLSGGETFLVSLALALGLADTVSNEAGGTQLDTLFIDEGFGALDATTLDAVMDTLDSLRDGGRVVGLVSHVVELRSRVPSQLEVRKARQGSTLRVSVATG